PVLARAVGGHPGTAQALRRLRKPLRRKRLRYRASGVPRETCAHAGTAEVSIYLHRDHGETSELSHCRTQKPLDSAQEVYYLTRSNADGLARKIAEAPASGRQRPRYGSERHARQAVAGLGS